MPPRKRKYEETYVPLKHSSGQWARVRRPGTGSAWSKLVRDVAKHKGISLRQAMSDPETKLTWQIMKAADKQAREVQAAENDRYAASLMAAAPIPAPQPYYDPRLFRAPAAGPVIVPAPAPAPPPAPYISSHLLVPSGIRPPPPRPPPRPSFDDYDEFFGKEEPGNAAPLLIEPPRDQGPIIVNAPVGPNALGPNEFAQARFDRAADMDVDEEDDGDEQFYDAREGPAEIDIDPNAGNYPLIVVPALEEAAEEPLYPVIAAPYDARMSRDGALGDVGKVFEGEHKYHGPVSNPDSIAREEAHVAHARALYPDAAVVGDEDEDDLEPGAAEPGAFEGQEPVYADFDQKQREWESKGQLGQPIDEGPDALDLLAARGELPPPPSSAPVVVPIDLGDDESKDIPVIIPQANVSVDVSGFDEPREVHVLPPGMRTWLQDQGLDESKMSEKTWQNALDLFQKDQELPSEDKKWLADFFQLERDLKRDQAEAKALLDEGEPQDVEEEFEEFPPDLAAPPPPPSVRPAQDVIVEERPEPVFVNPDELEREPQQPEVKAKKPGFFSRLRAQILPLNEEEAKASYLPRAFRRSTQAELEADDDRDLERRLADLSYPTEEIDALTLLQSINAVRKEEHKQPVRKLTPDMIAYVNSLRKKANLPTYAVTGDLDVELPEPGVEPEVKSAAAAVDVDEDVLEEILGRHRDQGPDFDPNAEDILQQHRRNPERKVHFKDKYGKGFLESSGHNEPFFSSKSPEELLARGRKRKLDKGGSSHKLKKFKMKKKRRVY